MKRIFKYPLPVGDIIEIDMPAKARPLCVQVQDGQPQVWALIEDTNDKEKRQFVIRGTGHAAGGVECLTYLGTFQLQGGALVFHVFYQD